MTENNQASVARNIPRLDDSNFPVWSIRMKAHLKAKGIFEYCINAPNPDLNGAALSVVQKKMNDAVDIIMNYMGDSAFNAIITPENEENPFKIWTKITARYASQSTPGPNSELLKAKTVALFLPCKLPFYCHIHSANEKDGWLLFEHAIPSSQLNRIFVRDSYKSIASDIQPGINKTIITGTPGIGKTVFLLYLLHKLVKEGKRVFFVYNPFNIYYDGQGGVFGLELLPSAFDDTFWTSDLWCLFDCNEKTPHDLSAFPYKLCPFVLSTSPRREMINNFKKPPRPHTFYMPIWTETELEALTPYFPLVANWRDRFQILGGIPRLILEDTADEPRAFLRKACSQCNIYDCTKLVAANDTIEDKSKVIHRLVHIKSVSPYTVPSVDFSTYAALDIIAESIEKEDKLKMQSLLASCEGKPVIAALRGHIFESYAIEMLEKGGKFQCRELGNTTSQPVEKILTIPSSARLIVDRVLPKQPRYQLHLPKSKNYPAIDAWIPGIGAFQMAVSKTHDIKGDPKGDLAMLGRGANKFYWLLPPLHYHSFTEQEPAKRIKQYAVLIPYPALNSGSSH